MSPRRIYQWEQWTDGRVHRLRRVVHFETSTEAFVKAARRYAVTHGLHVEACRKGDEVWLLLEQKDGL